jgi:hypothetical protein
MKITETQMAVLALIVIGLLYLYNTTVVYKNKPVYYPVYETEYVPVNRNINRGFRPDPRGRMPRPGRRPHPGHHIRKVDPIMPPAIPFNQRIPYTPMLPSKPIL